MNVSRIVLTGGGTAGHVMPHVAMLSAYQQQGYELSYIGSKGIERGIITSQGIDFHQISAGKLRRYFSFKTFTDAWKVICGLFQSLFLLYRLKPCVVISKGGYVSVPVVYAAAILRIPIIAHESDLTPGLATKLTIPVCRRLLYSFKDTVKLLPRQKSVYTGIPVRQELLEGSKAKGKMACAFQDRSIPKPYLLIMGGSQGSEKINQAFNQCAQELCQKCYVIHITGKDKKTNFEHIDYRQFEFVTDGLGDLFALADLVVTRAGANSLFEFLSIAKPMLLIPLEHGSRGDQLQNAVNLQNLNLAKVLREGQLTGATLLQSIDKTISDSHSLREAINKHMPSISPEQQFLNQVKEFCSNAPTMQSAQT